MTSVDLSKLLKAVETGDHNYYHKDVLEGVVDALKELQEARATLEDLRRVLDQTS